MTKARFSAGWANAAGCLAGVATLLLAGACSKNDMAQQVRVEPGERLALPAPGSVPVDGLEPPADSRALYENLINPIAASPESLERGRDLYEHHCAACHGPEGKGDGVLAEELGELVDLAELTGPDFSDGYLYSTIRHGGASMPGYGNDMEPTELWDVLNYIRTLAAQ